MSGSNPDDSSSVLPHVLAFSLGNLSLHDFDQGGGVRALDNAVINFESALNLAPVNFSSRHHGACALSEALRLRYHENGNGDDLLKALQFNLEGLSAVSPGDPMHTSLCWFRSRILNDKFMCFGEEQDLRDAAKYGFEALKDTGDEDPIRADRLYTVSGVLLSRYRRDQDLNDLEEALRLAEQAISCAQKHELARTAAHMGSTNILLNHLGVLLQNRFGRTGDVKDLDRSIECGQKTLSGADQNHATYLSNVGHALILRHKSRGDPSDLERAISLFRQGIETCTIGEKANLLSGLGCALSSRFIATAHMSDIELAIEALDEATRICPATHVDRGIYLNTLANLHTYKRQGGLITSAFGEDKSKVLFDPSSMESDGGYDEHCRAFEAAFDHVESAPHVRLVAGENAILLRIVRANRIINQISINDADLYNQAICEAYGPIQILCEQAITLLSWLSPRTLSRDSQQYKLSRLASLPAVAALACIRAKSCAAEAWELLETGSSVMSGLAMDSKNDLTQLTEIDPILAQQFHAIKDRFFRTTPLRAIRNMLSSIDNSLLEQIEQIEQIEELYPIAMQDAEDQSLRDCETKIRSISGFESFQLPFSRAENMRMAANGPIVAILAHRLCGSAALIVREVGFSFLPLPKLSLGDVEENVNRLLGRGAERLTSGGLRTKSKRNKGMLRVLRWLWEAAVRPVLHSLEFLDQKYCHNHKPLMWWHSSGLVGQLPLHAAGIYEDGSKENAMNYVCSSYTPTLKALRYARARQASSTTTTKPEALVVAMPETPDGKSRDLKVNPEIRAIREAIAAKFSVKIRIKPSCKDVISRLESASIAHFACHAVSDPKDPSSSKLKLYDAAADRVDPLNIRDISHLSYEKAQLAYLSACSTARNSVLELSFESIHIVNAFQLLGFPHVIGTLWQANDDAAALVARSFYRELFRQDRKDGAGSVLRLTSQNVVRALYKAISDLQAVDVEDVLTWVPFVHFGA
jgi:tetratricopeptide (TPR) repeat protein